MVRRKTHISKQALQNAQPKYNWSTTVCSLWPADSKKVQCAAAAAAKSLQSCLTLCDPIDGSPGGSPVPGILQARVLEWGATAFSNAWKWKVKGKSLSRVLLLATSWTTAHQAPPSMGFSRQESWSGVPFPSPSDIRQSQKNKILCDSTYTRHLE